MIPQTNRMMEEFYDLCTRLKIEATIQTLPNPSDFGMVRVITFQSFNDEAVKVIQEDGESVIIPAKGTAQVMLRFDELPPTFERIE